MLFKKMLRDMNEHKMQFIAIFLMAFISMLVLAGVGSEATGFQNELDNYYNETNMGNVWLYGDNIDNSTIDDINNISSTADSERQLVVDSTGKLESNPTVSLHFIEKDTISKYYPVTGSDIDLNDENGIWLDKRFADAKGLGVGDNITVSFNGTDMTKTIRGLGYSPEYIYEAPHGGILTDFNLQGFAYLSYKAFPIDDVPYNTVIVKTSDSADTYHDKLNDEVDSNFTVVPRSDLSSHVQVQAEIDQHEMFGYMLPVIFVVVAVLTLLTTMTRIVNSQRTQIGTLKALGFSNRSLVNHYISYGFYLTTAGCIIGLIVGIETVPSLFYPSLSGTYTLPVWKPGLNLVIPVIMVLIILLSVAFSYLATKNITRESPASALEPKAPSNMKAGFLEKTRLWKKLGFTSRWNLRDINRHKLRSIVMIIGVIGTTILLIASFGMDEGITDIEDWQYNRINHYQTQLTLDDNITSAQIENITNDVNGTQIMTDSIEVRANGVKKTESINVYNKTDLITPTDKNMHRVDLPENGISLTQQVADSLGVEEGDSIEWHMYGNDTWINSTVDKIYAEPTSQGITMSQDKLEDYGFNFTPTTIVTGQKIDRNITGVSAVNTIDDLQNSWNVMIETANIMISFLVLFAVLLTVVVLYSLELLGFTEVERDLATLKVIGFDTKTLRKIFLSQNLGLSIIGFIIGIPTGYYVLQLLWDSVGGSFYYPTRYSISTIGLTFILVIIMSIIVNMFISRRIKKVDMVESLKKGRE